MTDLNNRIALVTGASRGIGAAVALGLAKEGAHVIAVARTTGGLEELDDKIKAAGGTATLVPLDLLDTPGIERLAGVIADRYGRLDILVGNAGVGGPSSPLGHIEAKAWTNVMALNVTANWHLIRTMDGVLQKSDAARVVFLTSSASHTARAYRGPYSASKAALDALVRTYAAETATTPVKINLFNPGATRTRMRALVMPGEDPLSLPPPEDIAKQVVMLCLPSVTDSGRLYDYPSRRMQSFRAPA